MNIAEVERRTGLTRANIRFYEKEGLVAPARSANGYRDYTEADVETLRKVRLLRQLRLSVADIRAVQARGAGAARGSGGPTRRARAGHTRGTAGQGGLPRDLRRPRGMGRAGCEQNTCPSRRCRFTAGGRPGAQDRIPPAGCPWRRYFARGLDQSLYGLIWSMIALWGFRLNPAGQIFLGVDAAVQLSRLDIDLSL